MLSNNLITKTNKKRLTKSLKKSFKGDVRQIFKPRNKTKNNEPIKLEYGGQDFIDMISYSGLKENSSYIELDGKFVRTLFISGYPFVASTGWLSNLINFLTI